MTGFYMKLNNGLKWFKIVDFKTQPTVIFEKNFNLSFKKYLENETIEFTLKNLRLLHSIIRKTSF